MTRRYTEYVAFRHKLINLWPCLLISALPNKPLMGVSDEELYFSRSRYVIRFLKKVALHEYIYESEEMHKFLNDK